ncbi:proteasome assembly chaperone 2-like [Macrosteles quadrilineatus]|uniref:proteasome assembly chaperone 2-like n=1 Tax=Macrosteles quadrilineatus TaxID=74068 RepID=UPI0023E29E54|nr:proteasome assembly chaperone 2-like [Macrosteles quadrilineatus]
MESVDLSKIEGICANSTVILPAISVSNAGQLAVDLLIQSTKAQKLGNIWHQAFIPLIGSHPYKEDITELCTEFEVYYLKEPKVIFAQFRSPVWENKEDVFLDDLIKWFESIKASKIVIISSLYDYERNDSQIRSPHVRCCVCPHTTGLLDSVFVPLGVKPLELKATADTMTSGVMTETMHFPGAGFTKNLHLKCIQKGFPVVSLFKFCYDGDNTPEATELASTVDGWLNIVPTVKDKAKTLIQPPSWKYIFGGPSPQELFP